MLKKHHTVLHYIIGGAALALAGYANISPAPRTIHEAAIHQLQKPSRHDWPGLGQDKTIVLGDALRGEHPGKVVIFCSEPSCRDLALDIDDAMQIAEWKSDFEGRPVDSESDRGIFVGPPGADADKIASELRDVTGAKVNVVGIDNLDGGIGIIIGKQGN